MHQSKHRPVTVRERRVGYGDDECDTESLAGATLEDLPRARDGAHAARILARFALLRFWLLRCEAAVPALLDHARESAAAHLDAVDAEWAEGDALRRLLVRQEPLRAATGLLAAAAADAEEARDVHGAFGLRRAAYRTATLRLDLARAAELARELEAFLRRRGAPAEAERWAERRRRAATAAGLVDPPSLS